MSLYFSIEKGKEIGGACCATIYPASSEVTFSSAIVWFKALVLLLVLPSTA